MSLNPAQSSDRWLIDESDEPTRVIRAGTGATGEAGAPGERGADGTFQNSFQGTWNSGYAYQQGDIVLYATADGGDGSCYIALSANTNVSPTSEAGETSWAVIVERGEQGPAGSDLTVPADPAGGAIVPRPRGSWATSVDYDLHDIITAGGSAYICKADHTSGSSTKPETGASWDTKWVRYVKKGDTGPRGPRGYTPYIGGNGHWWRIDPDDGVAKDLGVPAQGDTGATGAAGADGADGADGQDGKSGVSLEFTGNGTIRFIAPFACEVSLADTAGTGTLNYSPSLPASLAKGEVLAVTASGVTSYKLVALDIDPA